MAQEGQQPNRAKSEVKRKIEIGNGKLGMGNWEWEIGNTGLA